jgi:hypothetical protein
MSSAAMITQLKRQYHQSFLDIGLPEVLHEKAIEKLLNVSLNK